MSTRRSICIILALVLALTMCFQVTAKEKSLNSLNKEIKEKQQELKQGKKKEKELMDSIVELEGQINELDNQIEISSQDLQVLTEELAEAEKKVKKQNKDLKKRLRNMYKNGSVGFLDVLLSSGSFSEFLTNMDMVQRILKNDEEVLESLEESQKMIAEKREEVRQLQTDLISAQETAEAEKTEIRDQKAALHKSNKEAEEEIDDLKEEMEALEAELAAKAASGEVSSSNNSKYKGGVFLWPTPGYTTITSDYGWRICPFHGNEFHAAIDIGADSGAAIIACASGKVIHAGWYGGFGNSVIIDHGGGLTTQYNHCSSVNVSAGQKVKKGETIAFVGSTGYSTGPHLDFRVYLNGNVTDPRSYL